jgi:hypothetical protein
LSGIGERCTATLTAITFVNIGQDISGVAQSTDRSERELRFPWPRA